MACFARQHHDFPLHRCQIVPAVSSRRIDPKKMFLPASGDVEIQASCVGPSDFLLPATLSRLRMSAHVASALCTVLSDLLQLLEHDDVLLPVSSMVALSVFRSDS